MPSAASDEPVPFEPPYPPSWLDRLNAGIERLPGPYWAPYLAACFVFLGLYAADLWRLGQTFPVNAVYSEALPFYGFWLIHYLNRRAAASLRTFQPVFTGSETELQDVRWRLTTLPAGPAAVVSIVSLAVAVAASLDFGLTYPYQYLGRLAFWAIMVFAGLYVYHSIRQLRLVTWLHARRAQVDLHQVAPLHAFSALSAHTAIGMLLILSGAALFESDRLVGPWLAGVFLFGALAVLIFVLPLTSLHTLLAEAKERELVDNSLRWKACMTELYRLVDRGETSAASDLSGILTSLERGRTMLERIPTWPWRPETLRSLVAALVLPVVIWLVQYGLQRWLG